MNTDMRASSAPRLFLGFCIALFGLVLLLDRLGLATARAVFSLWPLGLVLFGAALVAQAVRGVPVRFGSGYSRPHRSFFRLVIWGLVLSAIFSGVFHHGDDEVRADTRDKTQLFALLSGDQRASVSNSFRRADMTAVMGGTDLDLRHAVLAPGHEATVDVFALMGGVTVRVPEGWQVDVRVTPVMGGVRNERWLPASNAVSTSGGDADTVSSTAPPRLIIKGFVVMGGLIVKS
jgi:hypothetical protein